MGVLDDIKDTVSGSDSGSKKGRSSGSSKRNKTQGNSFSSNNSFSTDSQAGEPGNSGGLGGRSGDPDGLDAQNDMGNRSDSGGNISSNQGQGDRSFPNTQAGRPQQGSDQPQLSTNTRKKMENAGLKPSNNRGRGRGSDGRSGTISRNDSRESSQDPVSQDDFEDLKAQNQRIIELLQSINQNLQR